MTMKFNGLIWIKLRKDWEDDQIKKENECMNEWMSGWMNEWKHPYMIR